MIQVIHRALDIIEFVASEEARPKLLHEIATALQLKSGTCANIVKTLVSRGYLEKMTLQKGYKLGQQFLSFGNNNYKQELINAADAIMEALTMNVNENTLLATLHGNNRMVLHTKYCQQLVQANTPIEKNAYDSSTGRLLVAMQTDEELAQFIQRYNYPADNTWQEANTERKFNKQVALIRKQGYALIEDSVQIIGFAAPLYSKGKVIASLSIYIPAFRYSANIRNKFIKLGLAAAQQISAALH